MKDFNEVYDALLNLNKVLMLQGFESDYHIVLGKDDFFRFLQTFEAEHKRLTMFPNRDKDDIEYVKLAGPGSYFWVHKERYTGSEPSEEEKQK